MFDASEITGLTKLGFTIENGSIATITSGKITVAVLSGRRVDGLYQMIVKLPNGTEIFCSASPIELAIG